MNLDKNQFKFIKELSPSEVFSLWEKGEGQLESWNKVAIEKGWDSWKDWRWHCFKSVKGDKASWNLYEIVNPNKSIPHFKIGPTQSWQKHFAEKNNHTFQDLIDEHIEWVKQNDGVQVQLKEFPQPSHMIALHFPDADQLVLFEGHHRSAAITLAKKMGEPLVFNSPLTISIAEMQPGDKKYLDEFLEKGSKKPE